jgi:hypothetical protein
MGVQFIVVAVWISAGKGNNVDDVGIRSGLIFNYIFGSGGRQEKNCLGMVSHARQQEKYH